MMKMSSRERMLAALDCKMPGREHYVPCSFMLFLGLWSQSKDYLDFVRKQVDLGLDTFVQIPPRQPGVVNDYYNLHGLPISYDASVEVKGWVERSGDEETPLLVKEYHTPAGVLRTEVRQTGDWPYGDHVPFLDDYLVPRSRKFLVEGTHDLDALRYLLIEPGSAEVEAFRAQSRPVLELARERDLLIAGGWGVGADLIGWLFGLQNMLYAVYDQPEFIKNLLDIIARWNRSRMQVVLSEGIDLYIKRAWYENCDFWTPASFKEFIAPELRKDIALAHEHGVRFGYIITSNVMPLLDQFVELEMDVLIGVDPQGWDIELAKEKLAGKVCLWGGVNGHLTVERGAPDKVREEVRHAVNVLSPGGGFILSPVDNVREYTPIIQQNVRALIQEWQSLV